MIRSLSVALALAVGASNFAFAQTTAVVKARGTIEAITGDVLSVATRDGVKRDVHLRAMTRISLAMKASRDDLKPNAFIGVTAAPDANGGLKVLEIHIFPESLRGTGEGSRAYDLAPGSSMTNGALSPRVGALDGGELTVNYAGGAKTVRLPPDAPIVAVGPGVRDDVKLGAGIVATGAQADDGGLNAAYIVVGKDGVMPPM